MLDESQLEQVAHRTHLTLEDRHAAVCRIGRGRVLAHVDERHRPIGAVGICHARRRGTVGADGARRRVSSVYGRHGTELRATEDRRVTCRPVELIQVDHTAAEAAERSSARGLQGLLVKAVRCLLALLRCGTANTRWVALGGDVQLIAADLAFRDPLLEPVADPLLRRLAIVESNWVELCSVDELGTRAATVITSARDKALRRFCKAAACVDTELHHLVKLFPCHLLLVVERTPRHGAATYFRN